jgi:hypothetical protein
MKSLSPLNSDQKAALKQGVIAVSGKAMNRTALGVVDALFRIFPDLSFAELKEMLPDSINPSAPKNYKSLFKPYSERLYGVVQPGSIREECAAQGLDVAASHFVGSGETFRSSDGIEVLVSKSWESSDTATAEHDLENLIKHVEQYGIKVIRTEKKEGFNKGDYHIEILNPGLLHAIQNPAASKFWIYVVAALAVLAAAMLFFVLR